jgi:hypothetical protein
MKRRYGEGSPVVGSRVHVDNDDCTVTGNVGADDQSPEVRIL